MTATLRVEVLARVVRERLFAPGPAASRRVGLELEMLPLVATNGSACPLRASAGEPSTLQFIREHGAGRGWQERRSTKGAPYFSMPNGWSLTFEPGGQIEVCSVATQQIGGLIAEMRHLASSLRAAATDAGIELACLGIDPYNEYTAVSLQIPSERYIAMTRYFERIGPSGVRMMRQTAAMQVSLDGGADPETRWRLLADVAPYLTAIFANSSRYAGQGAGFLSFRERCWRLLDPTRTGVPRADVAPCEAYTQFAVEAIDMTRTTSSGLYQSFGDWVADGDSTLAQWDNHLTTLFPEVRPRGYLEVRSIDAVPPEILGAPVVLLAGLIYDPTSAADARDLLPPCDDDLLDRAARCGLHDPRIAAAATRLAELGLRGARRLGEQVVAGSEIERVEQFVQEYTSRALAPADSC